jgi:hypothetical protein
MPADGLCIEEGFGETAVFRDMFAIGPGMRIVNRFGPKPTRVTAHGANTVRVLATNIGSARYYAT